MTKTEIKAALKAKGIFDRNTNDHEWKQAFDLFFRETRLKLKLGCGSCYTRVRNWLNS